MFDKRNVQYHRNYASLKARGVLDKDYTLTIHKGSVRVSGYEYLSEFEKQKKAFLRLSARNSVEINENAKRERFANSLVRTRSNVVQLGANNPWEYFVTLTLSRDSDRFDAYDLTSVKKVLLKFFSNYAQRSGSETKFKYLLIPEKHIDGAWHFHGFMMGINPNDLVVNEHGYLDFVPYRERFGYVSFGKTKGDDEAALGDGMTAGRIRDLKRAASYITKYITKDMLGTDGHNTSEHLFFASKGLKKDETIVIGQSRYAINDYVEAGHEVHQNEFCAKIPVDRDYGLTLVLPWEPAAGERDRFNAPVLSHRISKGQRERLRRKRQNEWFNTIELQSRNSNPVKSVVKLTEREAYEISGLFEKSARRETHEQLRINI